ncbi:type II toxin-antitoxin system RelE/ParE family toxin [Rhizobium sp. HT1-10]|uniref:type II toxin-antitoxin system RelE/ParE family toxin n=1 Tax=Rhizobium sp. HT1-10 TaxID=3111638 RepID=UPI003C290965
MIKQRRLIWSGTARADLIEQYRHIAESNPLVADRFILTLERKVRSLARLGLTGVSRDTLKPGMRSFAYRQRVIYFVVRDQELFVIRILHGHQDTSHEDFTESSS